MILRLKSHFFRVGYGHVMIIILVVPRYSAHHKLSIIDKKYTHNLVNLGFIQIYIIQNTLIGLLKIQII